MTPEALYLQLGHLVTEMPDLNFSGPVPADVNLWLGRAFALVQLASRDDALLFRIASQQVGGRLGQSNAQALAAIVYRALAVAELSAPAALQGSFIPAGMVLDAFLSVGKVLDKARKRILMVDPYADEKVLEYALQAPEGVEIQVLTDREYRKPALIPAAERWVSQYASTRPLEVRLTPKRSLHDRALIVDRLEVWTVGQSFSALAARSPTTISRINEPEAVRMKLEAYDTLWGAATPVSQSINDLTAASTPLAKGLG